ncbi:D-alanyl-D-alanine carboxypeptidase [Arthrobacter sp. UM1]|uniref:D-alanyl-D-alanine carboxypeptidase n=1 Tax=Arthrobacter sp. UM1 TaxID=2766776 RepID=UPI001CF69B47|nr:D-alanyl-D-alanine carboxypeptidase [Arthrobacter sp. UM1]MCB4208906.1 D-alanyl-D-alanine carboxypeptidase [Arthrobacter sp. UM1]
MAVIAALVGVPAGWGLAQLTSPPQDPPAASSESRAWAAPSARPAGEGKAAASSSPSAASAPASPSAKSAAALTKAVADAPRVAGQPIRAAVIDAGSGDPIAQNQGDKPLPPASSLKVLTGAAILSTLDADATLGTSVTAGEKPGQVNLVGSGDALLGSGASDPSAVRGRAGLGTLAEKTAAAMAPDAASGAKVPARVTVTLDDSLFPEALNPAWPQGDLDTGQMTRLAPLAVNSAFTDESATEGPRVSDPGMTAADSFARSLEKRLSERAGHPVSVAAVRGKGSGSGGRTLASVQSATIAEQTEQGLLDSDNYVLETLARLAAAKSGHPATSKGVQDFLAQKLPDITRYPGDVRAVDASGLSIRNHVTPRALASAVRTLMTSSNPHLRAEAEQFPVSGLNGTLASRFQAPGAQGARGYIHAKTGTLNATAVLTGYTTTADGRLVAFALAYTGVEGALPDAKAALDQVAARIVAAGA